MTVNYILSQVFIIISYALVAMTYVSKSRKAILAYNLIGLIASGLSYTFLSAWTGLAMAGVAMLRNIIFLIQNRKEKSEKITWVDWIILGVLVAVSVVSAVFTYDGFLSLLSVFATMLYTLSVWQKNTKVYKFMGIPVSILWISYNIFIRSLFGILLEVALFVVEIIGIIKASKKSHQPQISENQTNEEPSK